MNKRNKPEECQPLIDDEIKETIFVSKYLNPALEIKIRIPVKEIEIKNRNVIQRLDAEIAYIERRYGTLDNCIKNNMCRSTIK